jgi:hypothetical protein
MSVGNLDQRYRPRSVALIGATPPPGVVARNLRPAAFGGELMLADPHDSILRRGQPPTRP